MKQYAVIHAVAGLFEGYSDTTCEFFPKRGFADKHIKQILTTTARMRCVLIDHREDDIYVTMTRQYEDYPLVFPPTWSTTTGLPIMDDVSVEVFRIIEIDPLPQRHNRVMLVDVESNRSRPSMGLLPLVHVIVARVSSDVQDATTRRNTTFKANSVTSSHRCTTATTLSSTSTTTRCTLSVSPNPRTLTAMTRYEKLTSYVEAVIEGMDFKDMYNTFMNLC